MKAVISYQDKILLIRESKNWKLTTHADLYGLVGGRIEPGENFAVGLKREVFEESGLNITIGDPLHVDEWRPLIKDEPWQIVGVFFECEADSDEVKLSEEHDHFVWIKPEEYINYNLMEPSKKAIEKYINKRMSV